MPHLLVGCKWRCGCLKAGSSPRLLDWDTVQHKLPWNVVILLGSGFALAKGVEVLLNPILPIGNSLKKQKNIYTCSINMTLVLSLHINVWVFSRLIRAL